MKSASVGAVLLLALLLAAGCASFPSLSPGTPAPEVESRAGAPAGVWKNPDGSEVWEYPQGPLGTATYMVSFGPDRAVREVRQVLNDETISRLRVGMSRDEVRRLVGKPGSIAFSDRTDEEIWSWLYREWRVRKMELHVQFDRPTGTVKGITRFQIDPGDEKRP
jgi:SmpA/OmlA family protein